MDRAARSMLYFGFVGLLVAGSLIAVLQTTTVIAKEGVVSVYFSSIASDVRNNPNIPDQAGPGLRPQIEIMSLSVTVDSVQVHRGGNPDESGWTEISIGQITLDLMKPTDLYILVATGQVPEQNITMIKMHVASAIAAVKADSGMNTQEVEVPSGELRVPVMPLTKVRGQLATSVIVERPHIVIQGTGGIMITPVMQVERVGGPE